MNRLDQVTQYLGSKVDERYLRKRKNLFQYNACQDRDIPELLFVKL